MSVALLLAILAAPLPHSPDLYVSGFFSSSVHRYYGPRSATTGAHPLAGKPDAIYASGAVRRPWGLAFGPDGNLYVANPSGATPGIARVDGPFSATAGTVHEFTAGGAPFDLAFGPDGNLYAGGHGPIERYDIVTGQLIDQFTKGHDLIEVHGVAFGPDGLLYVSNYDSCVMGPAGCTGSMGEIVRFDGLTGEFVDVWVHSGEGGLQWPWNLTFSRSGDLLVVNATTDGGNVLRFGTRRGFARRPRFHEVLPVGTLFIERADWHPLYAAIGPDGNVYVSASDTSGSIGSVLRFDGKSGAFIDTYVADVPGGPRGLVFGTGAQ